MNTATISTLVAAAALAASASAQFSTSFEAPTYTSGNIAGQDGWATPSRPEHARVLTAAEIAAEVSAMGITEGSMVRSGSQALLVSGTGGSSSTSRVITGFEAESLVALDLYSRPLTGGNSIGNFFFTMEDGDGTRAAAVRFGPDGIDYATETTTGLWTPTGVGWTSDDWHNIRMEANYSTATYDLFLDGVRLNDSPIAFYDTASDSFAQARVFRGSGQSGGIVDDLTVSVVPEPGTLSLFALGAGAMLLRRRK